MGMMDFMGAQPPMGAPPGGMPPMGGAPPAPPEEEAPGDPLEILRALIALTDEYRAVEQDEEDLLAIEKVRTLLQQLLAANQKMNDEAMGGTLNPRMMRKATGGY